LRFLPEIGVSNISKTGHSAQVQNGGQRSSILDLCQNGTGISTDRLDGHHCKIYLHRRLYAEAAVVKATSKPGFKAHYSPCKSLVIFLLLCLVPGLQQPGPARQYKYTHTLFSKDWP